MLSGASIATHAYISELTKQEDAKEKEHAKTAMSLGHGLQQLANALGPYAL